MLNEKFRECSCQISSQIKEEVGRLFPTLAEKTSPLPLPERVPDRARINAPNTPAPKRDAEERPVPARKGKGGKGRNEKEIEPSTQKGIAPKEIESKVTAIPNKEKIKPTPSTEAKKGAAET